MERTGKTFIIVTNDGPEREGVYVSWDPNKGYYTTVESISEIGELDFLDSVDAAIERAEEVNSSTFGGWNWAPMIIAELLNFYNAYEDNEYPELMEIVSITFN
jgi:hypothetical protein